jgi:hypothetical protein
MKNWDAEVWFSFIAVLFVIAACCVVLAGCADAKATATINVFGPAATPTSPAPAPEPTPTAPTVGPTVPPDAPEPGSTDLDNSTGRADGGQWDAKPVPAPDAPCEDKHTNGRGRGHGDGKHCKP